MLEKAKLLMQVKKTQKELEREIIEVKQGGVTVRIGGDQKIKKIIIDPEQIDLDDIGELERWLEAGVREAITRSQQFAAEKMKPLMGGLGSLGL